MKSEFPEDVQKLLNRYRELYNKWQKQVKENLGAEPREHLMKQ